MRGPFINDSGALQVLCCKDRRSGKGPTLNPKTLNPGLGLVVIDFRVPRAEVDQ